jgi:hypothetical protein
MTGIMMNMNDEDKYEVKEGDTVINFTAVEVSAEVQLELEELAAELAKDLVEGSAFAGHDNSENNARAIEY